MHLSLASGFCVLRMKGMPKASEPEYGSCSLLLGVASELGSAFCPYQRVPAAGPTSSPPPIEGADCHDPSIPAQRDGPVARGYPPPLQWRRLRFGL